MNYDFQPVPRVDPLSVLRPLTVVTCDGVVSMTIVQVRIDVKGVDYYCEWWDGNTLNTAWFDEPRLTPVNGDERASVGYKEHLR